MPAGSEFQTEGAATLKPGEAKVVWTRGLNHYPLDSQSQVIVILNILTGQAETFHTHTGYFGLYLPSPLKLSIKGLRSFSGQTPAPKH